VSDFEETDPNALPGRIAAIWRSSLMEKIITCVDRAAWLRAKTAQKKIAVKGLLECKGSRKPTEDKAHGQSVPCRFPRDAYCPTYLAGVGEFHAEHLTTDNMKLDDLSKEMWKKTFGTAGTTPVDNPSRPAGPSGSAAPSGGEVQMSG